MPAILTALKRSANVVKHLLVDHRYFASVRRGEIRDADGYIPWFTYPAIEALKTWDLSEKRVLEYGSGYSTLFWAKRAKCVVSIEHDPLWHNKVAKLIPPNVDLRLRSLENYPDAEGNFDVIVIDGYAEKRMRYRCALAAVPLLNSDGIVILDNSDWLPATCLWLRNSGLIQIDFCGFVPQSEHCQATSFFLSPQFAFTHIQRFQPVAGTGYNWEPKLEQELLASSSR